MKRKISFAIVLPLILALWGLKDIFLPTKPFCIEIVGFASCPLPRIFEKMNFGLGFLILSFLLFVLIAITVLIVEIRNSRIRKVLFLLVIITILIFVPIVIWSILNSRSACNLTLLNKGYCYKDLSQKYNDESFCSKVKDDYLVNECYAELAGKINQPELCASIKEKLEAGQFIENCIYTVAKNLNNPDICGKFLPITEADNCYLSVGESLNNINACRKISNQNLLALCLTRLKLTDLTICSEINKSDKEKQNICLDKYFKNLTSLSKDYCSQLSLPDKKMEILAKDNCYYYATLKEKDYSICGLISDVRIKNSCTLFIGQQTHDPKICDLVQNYNNERDVCFMALAKYYKNTDYCRESGGFRDDCLQVIAVANGAIELCDGVVGPYVDDKFNEEVRNRCRIAVFENFKDPSMCLVMTDLSFRDYCWVEAAVILKDSSYCNVIVNKVSKTSCISRSK